MSGQPNGKYSIQKLVHQSPPTDFDSKIDESWIKGKTIVITGGASGLGKGFFERWAAAGACLVIGDISITQGVKVVSQTADETGNRNLHFVHCNVTSWDSQVNLFKEAVKKSPHGGIDVVVASAGISDTKHEFEKPTALDGANPPPPDLSVIDVNLKGVMYTTHLAMFWLARNPGSQPAGTGQDRSRSSGRDRHLLLLSSMAGLYPIPLQTLYSTSKHALVGLYRSLRSMPSSAGMRINMLCPYFIDTPIVSFGARALLAGGSLGSVDSVIEAGTRLVADPEIVGRAYVVGPKMKAKEAEKGRWELLDPDSEGGQTSEIVEVYAHDFEETEVLVRRLVKTLNRIVEVRGWFGYFSDILVAVRSMFWKRKPR